MRRILAVMLGTVALIMMLLAALILALAIPALILRMTISTSISSNPPRRRAERVPTPIGSPRSKQR